MLAAPVDHPLDLATQSLLTWGSWGLTLVLLVWAIKLGREERTHFYLLMVLAVLCGALVEPIYDTAMMLYFYSAGGMWTHFSAFDIPQPVWTHSGYAILYAAPAVYVARRIGQGRLDARGLYVCAAVEFMMSTAFEIFGVNGLHDGAYTYWGPHVFRIADYPLAIALLETSQITLFATTAAVLRARVRGGLGLGALFVLFPVCFIGANLGAGGPMIISLHQASPSATLVAVGTLVSMAAALVLIRLAAGIVRDGRL
mgnify:CR=1 FL=1